MHVAIDVIVVAVTQASLANADARLYTNIVLVKVDCVSEIAQSWSYFVGQKLCFIILCVHHFLKDNVKNILLIDIGWNKESYYCISTLIIY